MAGAGLYYGQDITNLTPKPKPTTIRIEGHGEFRMSPEFFQLSRNEQNDIVAEIVQAQENRIDVETGGNYKTRADVLAEAGGGLAGAKL